MPLTALHGLIWAIAALATLAILLRPRGWPEATWAVAGAVLLVASALLPARLAWAAVLRGTDVYLFLAGMMLLAELARRYGVFDWLAALAVHGARGNPRRLFALVYGVGVLVTMLLSNDATAVVLTPAVYAVARTARAAPLPYLFICAFVANAASFVLPMANPANLVIFSDHLPSLGSWLAHYALPSLASILVTFAILRLTQRSALQGTIERAALLPQLSAAGRIAAASIGLTAAVLLFASARGVPLGAPACIAGAAGSTVALLHERESPWPLLCRISWSVLPLVAGLFVLIAGVNHTGLTQVLSRAVQRAAARSPEAALWETATGAALASNLANNLPIAVLAGETLTSTSSGSAGSRGPLQHGPASALLLGVDIGPNLSVTGSLATILWLLALRREGEHVGALQFLKLGSVVMWPALAAALTVVGLLHS